MISLTLHRRGITQGKNFSIQSKTRISVRLIFFRCNRYQAAEEAFLMQRGGWNRRKQMEQFVFRRISTVKIDPPIDHVRRVSVLQRANGHSE